MDLQITNGGSEVEFPCEHQRIIYTWKKFNMTIQK